MGNFYSAARDPIFYSHHSNIDRLWSVWKTLGGKRKDYIDPDWLNSGFLFYDENKQLVRVYVCDSLDTKKLGYVYQDVDLPWLTAKPKPRRGKIVTSSSKTTAVTKKTTTAINFPITLDKVISTVVPRPKKSRSKEEKENEEEVLVIEGIEFDEDYPVKFDVHVNDDEQSLCGPENSEFSGSFVNVPHRKRGDNKIRTHLRLGITDILEDLGADDDDSVFVTLVPKSGKGLVTISGIKIEFIS
ncbi:Polyphenol oxidase [Morus notabilis]|uniref:Polyphenol oxidase n=1 Tax=Morus notabilis TaxID=981085 RepID=W9RD36_9ROSA|nr:Polyphenol oxidase [Morus notabilis]